MQGMTSKPAAPAGMTLPLMHKTATELSAKFAGLLTDTELQQLVEARKAVQLNLESPPSSRDNSHQAESSQTRDATENTADSDARASFEPASVTSKPAVARASRNESELSFAAAIKPQPPGFLGVAGQGEVVISMGSGTPGKPRPPAFMDDVDFTFDDDSTTGFNAEEFYNRNIKWKEAREKQAEEQRRVREQAAVKECTFTPRINKKSARLAAKAEYVTLCTPRPEGFSPEAAADAGSGQSSPDAATVPHAERMYQAAAMYRAKLELARQQLAEEEAAMRETAVRSLTKAARKVEPRVYATESHKEPNFLPTGMEECTFKPKTNVGGGAAAALGRGRGHSGSEVTDELQTTTGSTGTGSGGRAAEVGGHPLTALGSDLGDAGEWDDFISRQQEFLERKQRKLDEAVGALRAGGAPAMSPGTKRILARAGLKHKALEAAAEADGLAAADGTAGNGSAGRPHSALDGGGSRLQQPTASSATKGRRPTTAAAGARGSKDAAAYVDPECTFKPAITKLAQRMPSRSFAEMSEQARAREEWLEEQRIMRELESMADATFRPQLVAQRSYAGPAASKLELRDPQKYMAMVQARQRAKQEVLNKAALEREARQLEECTFKPSINKLPAYLERRYHHQSTQADDGRGSELGYAGRALRSASTTQDDLPDYR